MSDVLMLYLFTRLDVISGMAVGLTALGLVVAFGALVKASIDKSDAATSKRLNLDGYYEQEIASLRDSVKVIKVAMIAAGVAMSVALVVPSKADMAIIVGGKIALDASRSPEAAEMGRDVLDAIRAQLKKAKE